MWGKCLNAGQTGIAPDYLFCHKKAMHTIVHMGIRMHVWMDVGMKMCICIHKKNYFLPLKLFNLELQDFVEFLECAKAASNTFYGEDPQKSPDLCRIAARSHAERIAVSGSGSGSNIFYVPTILVKWSRVVRLYVCSLVFMI